MQKSHVTANWKCPYIHHADDGKTAEAFWARTHESNWRTAVRQCRIKLQAAGQQMQHESRSASSHHARVYLAEARRAEDVEQQLLLDAGSHPQEEVESRLQEVNSAFRQPLLRVPHRHRQRPAFQLRLESRREETSYDEC